MVVDLSLGWIFLYLKIGLNGYTAVVFRDLKFQIHILNGCIILDLFWLGLPIDPLDAGSKLLLGIFTAIAFVLRV